MRVIRPVERSAAGIIAGPGVVSPDDEMRATVVLPDDRVPHCLARAAHAHRQRQQRKLGRVLRVAGQQRLITADSRVMVNITRLGHSNHRMNQEVCLHLLGRPQCKLLMRPMHRVARLKRHHLTPSELGEGFPQFHRRMTDFQVVVVNGSLDSFELPADVHRVRLLEQMGNTGMLGIVSGEDGARFGLQVRPPHFFDV